MGVFVDIYPIDPMGSDEKEWERVMHYRQQLIAGSYYASRIRFEKPGKSYRCLDRYLLYRYAKKRGLAYFLNKLESYKNRYRWEDSRYAGCIVWEPELFEKEYFEEVTRLPFCMTVCLRHHMGIICSFHRRKHKNRSITIPRTA